jgi:arsenate reductase (thioredoxin)
MLHVIFACVHNAGRSQMAAALFNALCDPNIARASSAGTAPAERVHPTVVTAMQEIGIEVTDRRPTRLTSELAATADLLVTMGCGEECPVVPGVRRQDWPLPDPAGQPAEVVRQIRNQIASLVRQLLKAENVLPRTR